MKIKHSILSKSDLLKIILLKSVRMIQARRKVFTIFFFHVVKNFISTILYNIDSEICAAISLGL